MEGPEDGEVGKHGSWSSSVILFLRFWRVEEIFHELSKRQEELACTERKCEESQGKLKQLELLKQELLRKLTKTVHECNVLEK